MQIVSSKGDDKGTTLQDGWKCSEIRSGKDRLKNNKLKWHKHKVRRLKERKIDR